MVNGLGPSTRIGMKALRIEAPFDTVLMAELLDSVNLLLWIFGSKGGEKPESYADMLKGIKKKTQGFDSGEDFEKERKRIIEGA